MESRRRGGVRIVKCKGMDRSALLESWSLESRVGIVFELFILRYAFVLPNTLVY